MTVVSKYIRKILREDNYVSSCLNQSTWKNQEGITLIAAGGFAVMSLLNIFQKSYLMLASTVGCALVLLLSYLIGRHRKNLHFLQTSLLFTFLLVFTAYTVMGGNDGFAALWLLLAPYVAMLMIDLRRGFAISVYFLVMLDLLFLGPLHPLLQFSYSETFRLRFPFLYAIDFSFATFIVLRIRSYQYELLLKQQELRKLSRTDSTTGLLNRNCYNQEKEQYAPQRCRQLCVVFIDLNGLHEVNNRDGHIAGDRMLRLAAKACRETFPNDSVYRMGGDEFLVLCKNRRCQDVMNALQELCRVIDAEGSSISCGVAERTGEQTLTELVESADREMLLHKMEYYKTHGFRRRASDTPVQELEL